MKKPFLLPLFLLFICFATSLSAQQSPDTTFTIQIPDPAYGINSGPTICIDSAHHNFHTLDGGYAPFARVMRADGYQVTNLSTTVHTAEVLEHCRIYLVANPLHERNLGNWQLPTPPAFTPQEIREIHSWVQNGGSLFLIADHMPFAGAASELADAFGFQLNNGFAFLAKPENQPDIFSHENGRLPESLVSDEITTVTSFTGSAFTYPEDAVPVMAFKEGDYSLEPEIAWQFNEDTKRTDLKEYAQGALLEYEDGKVAMFGEAAMFTAQIITTGQGTVRVGINSERLAPQNIPFLLNLIHWLEQ